MNIRIICVGKLKEDYMKAACADYAKRLGRYCKLEIIEVADERAPETLSHAEMQKVLAKEGARIQGFIKGGDIIALDIGGKAQDSLAFSGQIGSLESAGKGTVNFVIGGSLGLDRKILDHAERISFGKMTYPHNIARLLLLEQLYRAMKINRGETYHK